MNVSFGHGFVYTCDHLCPITFQQQLGEAREGEPPIKVAVILETDDSFYPPWPVTTKNGQIPVAQKLVVAA